MVNTRGGTARAVRLAVPLAWLAIIVLARLGISAPGRLLAPVPDLLASLVQSLMGWAGTPTLRHGAFLYVPGTFAYEISVGCSGLLPAAVLALGIVLSPGTREAKAWGLAVGVPLVLLVNLLRLTHLFYLGIHAPQWFAAAHVFWWEAVIVAATFAVWLAWAAWARRGDRARRGYPDLASTPLSS